MRFGDILFLLAFLVALLLWFGASHEIQAKENRVAFENLFGKNATQEQVLDQISELQIRCELDQINERSFKTAIRNKHLNQPPPSPWQNLPAEVESQQAIEMARARRQSCSLFDYAKKVVRQKDYFGRLK